MQVWRGAGAGFTLAWKGSLGSTAYGAYNHIFVRRGAGGEMEKIFTSTTGGLKPFDVVLPAPGS